MFFYPPTMPFSKPTTKPTSKSSSQIPKVENVASGIIKGPPIREILINNIARIRAFNTYIALGDILQDNNYRLIVIDTSKNLKIFKGNVLQDESKLSIFPAGLVVYYGDDPSSKNIIPLLAVAGGNTIFIYRNLKGIIKYPLPDQKMNGEESYIYQQYNNGLIDGNNCLNQLQNLADRLIDINIDDDDDNDNVNDNDNDNDNENNDNNNKSNTNKVKENKNEPLSQMTLELLSLKTEEDQLKFLEDNKTTKVLTRNYITCINYIKKDNSNDLKASSYLIVGTENCLIFLIDHNNKTPLLKKRIYEVPFIIEAQGGYNTDHKIFVSDRGYNVYILKKDTILNKFIMPQPLVNLLIAKNNFYIGTIGNNYISYSFSGNIVFKINQPSIITCMEIYYRKSEDLNIIIIALKNKEVRFYNDKKLIIIMNVHDNIFGMKYGKFQMTEDCLVLSTYSGIIMIKNFGNDIKFSEIKYEEKKIEEGKILVPKKSVLFLDLVEREKENSFNMQNIFQNDLLRIRYKAMDSYVKMLKIGNAPQNYSSSSTIKISGSLEGLGPNFKLNLILDNSGHEPIINAILTLDFNRKLFYFDKENIILSIIMPHVPIKYSLPFKNISENGSSGMIKIIIMDKFKNSPLIQTTIKVPVSELEML